MPNHCWYSRSAELQPFQEKTVVYVKREQSDENREVLLATASRLFRERALMAWALRKSRAKPG